MGWIRFILVVTFLGLFTVVNGIYNENSLLA